MSLQNEPSSKIFIFLSDFVFTFLKHEKIVMIFLEQKFEGIEKFIIPNSENNPLRDSDLIRMISNGI